jgi:hypothetical protein
MPRDTSPVPSPDQSHSADARAVRHRSEKHVRRRRHSEPCRMMLSDMVGVIALGLEYADEP